MVDVLGFLPLVIGDVPEMMILGCGHRTALNSELEQRVLMRPNSHHHMGPGIVGLG